MFQATDQDIHEAIKRYGLMVLRDCGGEHGQVRTITCGFTEHGLPELICLGLDSELIWRRMNQVFHEMVIAKIRQPGPFVTDEWFSMEMRVVNAERKLAAQYAYGTERYYAGTGKTPQYMQMAWPDATGKFPWEPGFAQKYRDQQPNLKTRVELVSDISTPTP
jgi:hypothetical protein